MPISSMVFCLANALQTGPGLVTNDKIGGRRQRWERCAGFLYSKPWGVPDEPPEFWEGKRMGHGQEYSISSMEDEGAFGAWWENIEYIYSRYVYKYRLPRSVLNQNFRKMAQHIYFDETRLSLEKMGFIKKNYLWVSNQHCSLIFMVKGITSPPQAIPRTTRDYEHDWCTATHWGSFAFCPTRTRSCSWNSQITFQFQTTLDNRCTMRLHRFSLLIIVFLASANMENSTMKGQVFWLAEEAKKRLPEDQP